MARGIIARMTGFFGRLGEHFGRRPRPIPDSLWQSAVADCALVVSRPPAEQAALRELAGRFLAHKRFAPVQGAELDDTRCLIIAIQACLPVLHLGFGELGGWREVVVYPGEFKVRREQHDEHTGVVTEGEDVLIGEAWEHGPLVLSWTDIEADLRYPHDGLNVIVHEIAHELDMRDGASDGVPPLSARIPRREWIDGFQRAYDAHCGAVDRGHETIIDPYAAESADEFFACVSEMHFSTPTTLAEVAPAVANLLRRYYDAA